LVSRLLLNNSQSLDRLTPDKPPVDKLRADEADRALRGVLLAERLETTPPRSISQ